MICEVFTWKAWKHLSFVPETCVILQQEKKSFRPWAGGNRLSPLTKIYWAASPHDSDVCGFAIKCSTWERCCTQSHVLYEYALSTSDCVCCMQMLNKNVLQLFRVGKDHMSSPGGVKTTQCGTWWRNAFFTRLGVTCPPATPTGAHVHCSYVRLRVY